MGAHKKRKCSTACPCHKSWTQRYITNLSEEVLGMEVRLDPTWAYLMGRLFELMEE